MSGASPLSIANSLVASDALDLIYTKVLLNGTEEIEVIEYSEVPINRVQKRFFKFEDFNLKESDRHLIILIF